MTYKVLIVDDSKLARMAVAKALNALYPEWTRVEATNADEALALARQSPPDIALLDFNMPGRDGVDLAGDFQAMNPAMPVAVISANLQHEVVARAAQAGAVFLAKPLTQDALSGFLSGALLRIEAAAA
jgi:DNA-binding NarL/FixJ family response regulator